MFWFCSTSISLGKCVKSATAQPDSTAFRREGSWDQSGTCGLFTVPLEGLVRASISFRLESANGILPALGLILANTLDLHVLFFFFRKGIFFAENEVNLKPTWIPLKRADEVAHLHWAASVPAHPPRASLPTPHCDFWLFLVFSKTSLTSPSLLHWKKRTFT